MTLYVGTSGYSYKEWKGNFYPEKIPAKEMLSYYAARLPAGDGRTNDQDRIGRQDLLADRMEGRLAGRAA